jgi:hypothetical protein
MESVGAVPEGVVVVGEVAVDVGVVGAVVVVGVVVVAGDVDVVVSVQPASAASTRMTAIKAIKIFIKEAPQISFR